MVIGCAMGACGAGAAIIASVTGGVGSAALLRQTRRKTRRKTRMKTKKHNVVGEK